MSKLRLTTRPPRDQDTEALRKVTEALVEANGSLASNVQTLATYVSKSYAFLWPRQASAERYGHNTTEDRNQRMAMECEVFMGLASRYIRPYSLSTDDDNAG